LVYQIGALLAALGVHRGAHSLRVLADGARWIRDWFERLGLSGQAMIICWYHVVKRCQQDLSRACRGRERRREVESAVLGTLWRGGVDEALEALRGHREEMKNVEAIEELIGYLEARRPYLPDYEARRVGCGSPATGWRDSTTGASQCGVSTAGWNGPEPGWWGWLL
jgi:hypothetical protein